MAYGDPRWDIDSAGSTAITGGGGSVLLLGSYQGLSANLNENDVVYFDVVALNANSFKIGTPGNVSNNKGLEIYPSASRWFSTPPMRVGTASLIEAHNGVTAINGSVSWVIWYRV